MVRLCRTPNGPGTATGMPRILRAFATGMMRAALDRPAGRPHMRSGCGGLAVTRRHAQLPK
ncbi:hypothetical protein WS58_11445 [Burkholderia pseudomultivorans]|nr:hypothetical protein B1M_18967 [Burkholderia sp. TJI49]KVC46519.1 hypothetical protein WS58_11445 [Burkholderia pseudomultivorans]